MTKAAWERNPKRLAVSDQFQALNFQALIFQP
jgi:hypothetical protein